MEIARCDGPLSRDEVDQFLWRGFVPLRRAFARELARECVALLWEQLDEREHDPSTWRRPVVRLGGQVAPPFEAAMTSGRLLRAFDQLVGVGRWVAHPFFAGTIPVRFPVEGEPGDDGWHVDGAFDKEGSYWLNERSDGRALLMLVLFSDVDEDEAPTRIRVGSHLDVPVALDGAGEAGRWFGDVVGRLPRVHDRELASATGEAGDVYLCHPFLVHAADRNRGRRPRFVGQPGLLHAARLDVESPVEQPVPPREAAIRIGRQRLRR
jgi:hypothetical protein